MIRNIRGKKAKEMAAIVSKGGSGGSKNSERNHTRAVQGITRIVFSDLLRLAVVGT